MERGKSIILYYTSFLLIIICLNEPLKAQEKQIMFRNIGIENGLSNNSINVFLRDQKGFIWIGTSDGLNRFDGYSFKIYKHNPDDSNSIASTNISNLAQDYKGTIWIGAGEYLDFLDPVTDQLTHIDSLFNNKIPFPVESRWLLKKDKWGRYWYSNSKQGVFKYFTNEDSLVKVTGVPDGDAVINRHRITGMAFDSVNNVWVIDYTGKLVKFQNQTLKKTDSLNIGATYDNYYNLFIDADDNIWIYDLNNNMRGIKFIDIKLRKIITYNSHSTIKLNSDIIRGINQDDEGNIWISTDHGGLNLIDKVNSTIRYINNDPLNSRSLAEDAVHQVYRDAENFMWIGTYKQGFSYYHKNLFKFNHIKIILPESEISNLNDIDNFTEDKNGNLWIGTNGAGLFYYDRKKNTYRRYAHDPNNQNSLSADVIIGLTTDRDGNIWAGTYFGGLNKWDGQKFTCFKSDTTKPGTLTDDRVWDICQDKDGLLWIATLLGGVNVFDPKQGKVIEHFYWSNDSSIRSNVFYTIIEDSDGLIWFATVNGVRSYNKQKKQFTYYAYNPENPASLSSNLVFDIMEDSRGLIWAATSNGISIIDKGTQKITRISEKDGLPSNRIVTLLEDDNKTIWAGTSNGLSNIIIQASGSTFDYKIINYDKLDGLQGNIFNEKAAYKTSKGELLFGGSNGFNIFNPHELRTNPSKPNLVFTDFLVYNISCSNKTKLNGRYLLKNDITYTRQITLFYDENLFTIEFSNLNYFQPERYRYQYRMVNFNDNWLNTSAQNRRVTYTNLDPGNYTFEVRVANPDGTWNPEIASLKITILPPWWKTWLFRFLVIITLVSLVILIYYIRFSQLNIQKKMLEKMVTERTHELTLVNTILEERQEEISIQNEELNYHREKLENLVTIRTADLEKALKKAEDSDRLKSAFLANMSHEIRTPMNAIVGFANLLRDLDLTKTEQDEYIDIILNNCDALLVIINDILDISKIEANQLNIIYKEFDLATMFEGLYSYYQLRKTNNVEIIYVRPDNQTTTIVFHDEIRIRQVMQNIIDNAIKFTKSGHVKFGFNLTPTHLECFVEDTGKGIDADQQHNIFKPFVKIEDGVTQFQSGAGLGLAICKRIANLMNGELSFVSEKCVGTTFTFKIPLKS